MRMKAKVSSSPWGLVDHVRVLAEGIESVATSSHGGIHLDEAHAAFLRDSLWSKGFSNFLHSEEWWEEDCDWSIPIFVFQDEIRDNDLDEFANHLAAAKRTIEREYRSFVNVFEQARDAAKRQREALAITTKGAEA